MEICGFTKDIDGTNLIQQELVFVVARNQNQKEFLKMIKTNRSLGNFSEYQFKGSYNRCCNFPNPTSRTSLNNNIKSNFGIVLQAGSNL